MHYCMSPLALGLPHVKPKKRVQVIIPFQPLKAGNKIEKHKKPTDSSHSIEYETTYVRFPSNRGMHKQIQASKNLATPLDALIVRRKDCHIPRLLNLFPNLRRVTRTALLVARSYNVKAMTDLHKVEGFSKDAFTHLLHVALVSACGSGKGSDRFLK